MRMSLGNYGASDAAAWLDFAESQGEAAGMCAMGCIPTLIANAEAGAKCMLGCGFGQPSSGYQSSCPSGYVLNSAGQCQPLGASCPSGYVLNSAGQCQLVSAPAAGNNTLVILLLAAGAALLLMQK